MNKKTAWNNMPALLVALCAFAFAATLCALAHPATAMADERVAHSVNESGVVTDYYDIASARSACYDGITVVMDTDWKFEKKDHFIVPAGKKVTLDMNGHRIDSNYLAFFLNERSELVLTSSAKSTFTYRGYSGQDGSEMDVQTTTGGLVKVTDNHSSAIQGSSHCTVTLDGVTLGGVRVTGDIQTCDNGIGAVYLDDSSTLNMKNGASIEHNLALKGAGVYAADTDITINMDNSSISNNYAEGNGGGILCDQYRVYINMANGAKIDGNTAGLGGGGIYFRYPNFYLKSEDHNAFVSNNCCLESSQFTDKSEQAGGGIHVEAQPLAENEGLIEGITISDNYSAYDGGGIELDQKWTIVRDCTITGNSAYYEGGGIYDCNDKNIIDNCTITDNACNLVGKNYEGGGIYVWCDYDITMNNVCIVKGNTRGKDTGNADDVFLREKAANSARAYITGTLLEGSCVGVRTGIEGDRRVAKNFKNSAKNSLFADLDGYYISYGSDEGGDAWQRHATKEFTATVNGQGAAKYKQGSKATLVAPATVGDDIVFWHWDLDKTTGLYPIDDYITDKSAFSNVLSFKMPQNDVDAVPVYATRAKKVGVGIKAPVAGEALPASAELYRLDGAGLHGPFPAALTWYEVGADGSQAAASGIAKADTAYAAEISIKALSEYGLYFNPSISAQDVTLVAASGSTPTVAAASVDAQTGRLTIKTGAFDKTAAGAPEAKTGTVTVACEGKGLLGGGQTEAALSLAGDGDAGLQPLSEGGSLGEIQVSYSYSDGSDKVTITAPHVSGYNFCNWENARSGWDQDDVEGTVSIPASDLEKIDTLVACYTPAVTGLEVSLDAPVGGKELATEAADVRGACSDGSEVDFADEIGVDGFKVTWSPEPEDGTAGYSTTYTALVELCDAGGIEGAEDVLKQGAKVTCNGVEATSAGFVVTDGKLCLALAFPATDAVRATSIAQPGDVELTFEQAAGCSAEQAAHADELCWPLPKTVSIQLENGETVDGDITWDIPEGFDASATAAQEITVKGTVGNIASEDEIDTSGIGLDVSTTIRIAAPSQGGGEDDGGAPAADPGNAKSASAKTGDVIPVFAVAAIAVVAVAAVVAAIAALRRRKN